MNLHDADVPRGPDAAPGPPGAGRFRRALALYFGSEVMLSVGISLVNYAQPFFFQHGGMTDGLLMATENVVLSSLTPDDNKASVLSRFVAFYMCAIGAGMVAGGWLSAAHGYRTTMLVGAAVTLTSPCIRWFVRAPDALAQRAFRRPPVRLASMGLYSAGIGIWAVHAIRHPRAQGPLRSGRSRCLRDLGCLSAGMFGATYLYLRRLLTRLRRGAAAQTPVAAQERSTSQ